MPSLLARRGIKIAAVLVAVSAAPAAASDYFNACTVAGERYEILDDALLPKGDGERKEIKHEKVSETILAETNGYCLVRGQRYGHEARTSVRRIRFTHEGQTHELDALCELASDGLPAALKCNHQVTTRDFKIGSGKPAAPRPGSGTIWVHNGSLMRVETDGDKRRILYELPRTGMVQAGAKAGDVVVELQRKGSAFTGTAYVYSKTCGRTAYAVKGQASLDERRVVVEGQAPRQSDDCKPKGNRRDRLQFDLVPR